MSSVRSVLLLGASGSIGTQTIDVLSAHPERFVLTGFSVGKRVGCIPDILARFPTVTHVCVQQIEDAEKLSQTYPNLTIYHGDEGLVELIEHCACDMVVNALVGFAGLVPTMTALRLNKILCLANKESLVVGGGLIRDLRAKGIIDPIIHPIDSEHSGVAKLLTLFPLGERDEIKNVFITASGGSFRHLRRDELEGVTPEQALAHPTWSMGAKITIDCATMMNKGFEIIEACELFHFSVSRVHPIMHDESRCHAIIESIAGEYYADISEPDMHGPIEYALFECKGEFKPAFARKLEDYEGCHFHPFDPERYPAVGIALHAYKRGGNATAILNAANEAAVYAFLDKRLPFLQIEEVIQKALDEIPFIERPSLEEIIATDKATRAFVEAHIGE